MSQEEPKSLVPHEPEALDAYEQQYMAGEGKLLHHDKRPAPKWMQALTGSMALVGLAMLFSPAWLTGLVFIPIGVVLWSLFAVLRFNVSEGAVKIQYGLFGPTIPIASIERAEAVDYDWKTFGGWGIRRSLAGETMYNMPGDHGRAVRIVWRDGKGRQHVTNVGTPQPEAAVAAIRTAQAALPSAATPGSLPPGRDE
jgi:hypothetical protein